MTHISVGEFRNSTADSLNRVAYGGEHLVLDRRGKPIAAIISIEDFERFRELEDQADLKAIAESKKEPGEDILWDDLKEEVKKKRKSRK